MQLLISVPKKRFKHAVDRNRVKRQVREAYRKNKSLLEGKVNGLDYYIRIGGARGDLSASFNISLIEGGYPEETTDILVDNAYRILFLGALVWFGLLLLIMLIRAIIGPRVTDRILSINMICTMVIACTCILAFLLDESYLFDVALLYALISFITVLILSATYIPKNPQRSRFISDMKKMTDQSRQSGGKDGVGE